MKRIKTCAIVSLLLLSILAPCLITSTKATGNLWYTYWGDFRDYSEAPKNISSGTTASDVTGIYQYKVSLGVSVYQYQRFAQYDAVIFRVAVYIESSSTELPAYAWQVMIDIEKDTGGSNLNRQRMEVYYSTTDPPGFTQSYGLSQTTSTSSTTADLTWWGIKTLVTAASYFMGVGTATTVATGLISLATAFLPAGGVDHRNAGREDPEALIWWNEGFGGLGSNKQYCLNTMLWMQDPGVNPSTYYGLKIWARVGLEPLNVPGLPPDVDTPPVYLRIYHNDPPRTPSTPSGNTSGFVGTSYTYSTSTTDPNGDNVQYEFNWGDGYTTTTPYKASGVTVTASHSWSSPGTYNVTVRAQDSYNLWSNWSPPLTVNIRNPYLTVLAQDGRSLTSGYVYIDGQYRGRTGSTFTVTMGTHTVFVDNVCWGIGNFAGYRYVFLLWEDGSTANPRTITVVEDTTIKAHFYGKYCPGDIDGDGRVGSKDQGIFGAAYGSRPGYSNWDSRCDLDGSGVVNSADLGILGANYGNVYPDP